jgi:hypothetical protein
VLARNMPTRLVVHGLNMKRMAALMKNRGRSILAGGLAFGRDSRGSGTLLVGLSLVLCFLLENLPIFSYSLELCDELCVSRLVLNK